MPSGTEPLVEAARKTIKKVAPHAIEIPCAGAKPRSPSMMWKLFRYAVDDEVVVTIGTFTKHASMFFAHGAELDDPDGLLEGGGKKLRYITLRTPADATGARVERLVKKAFARLS